jgi:hypothetical protein
MLVLPSVSAAAGVFVLHSSATCPVSFTAAWTADLEALPADYYPRARDVDVNAADAGQLGQRNGDGVSAMSTGHPRDHESQFRSSLLFPVRQRCRVSEFRSVAATMRRRPDVALTMR